MFCPCLRSSVELRSLKELAAGHHQILKKLTPDRACRMQITASIFTGNLSRNHWRFACSLIHLNPALACSDNPALLSFRKSTLELFPYCLKIVTGTHFYKVWHLEYWHINDKKIYNTLCDYTMWLLHESNTIQNGLQLFWIAVSVHKKKISIYL